MFKVYILTKLTRRERIKQTTLLPGDRQKKEVELTTEVVDKTKINRVMPLYFDGQAFSHEIKN